MLNPSPVPPYLREIDPSACANGSKMRRKLLRGDTNPRVHDIDPEACPSGRDVTVSQSR